jgi:hypothetical protein
MRSLPGNPPAAQSSCPPATANIAPRSVIGVRCHQIRNADYALVANGGNAVIGERRISDLRADNWAFLLIPAPHAWPVIKVWTACGIWFWLGLA